MTLGVHQNTTKMHGTFTQKARKSYTYELICVHDDLLFALDLNNLCSTVRLGNVEVAIAVSVHVH